MGTNLSSTRYEIGHPEYVASHVYGVILNLIYVLVFMETSSGGVYEDI